MSLDTFLEKTELTVSDAWTKHVAPWLASVFKGAVHAEVAALLPLASAAAGSLAADLATNSGNMSAFAETASAILKDTAAKAEQQAIQAGGASLLAAVASAITAHAAAVPLGGEAPPVLPPKAVEPVEPVA